MKKKLIIISISLIVLYFCGNLGLYLYIKFTFNDDIERAINYTPKKLKLSEESVNADTLHLMGFKLKFPFYKEDIKKIIPFVSAEHKFYNITLLINTADFKTISIIPLPEFPEDIEESSIDKILNKTITFKDPSFLGISREMHYARLKDYSWWNIRHNLKLFSLLILKSIAIPASFSDATVYDVETPYLKGFLREGTLREGKKSMIMEFGWEDKDYSIHVIGKSENSANIVKTMMSTIKKIDDIEKSYTKMENLYRNKKNARYPEELLIFSMISIKGPTSENLEKLLKIMQEKNYSQNLIDDIKKEIEYLKNKNDE